MHKVAIIKFIENERHGDDYSYSEVVANSITEWEEVDDEQYKLLCKAAKLSRDQNWDNRFEVIEKLQSTSAEIVNNVSQYIAMATQKEEAARAAKAAREATAEKKRQAKLMKDKESRKRLLAELQAEFAPTATK